jgi:hypothetical protein
MTTTPILGATDLVSAQALPETTVNETVRRIEQGAGAFSVKNQTNTPPGSPADGDSYIVTATATGAWTGWELSVAYYQTGTGWLRITPREGMLAWDQTSNDLHYYSGAAWIDYGSGAGLVAATTTEQLVGTSAGVASTPDSVAALWEQGADVASAGTISLGEGGYFNVTGTTAITDVDFATDKAGRKAWVKFAGILTFTNGANLILPTGANITTAAGDTACLVSEGSDVVRCVSYQRADGTALAGSGGGTFDSLTDVVITSAAQGDVIYYNGSNFVNLGPGTSGHFLKTQGAGANPVWAAASGSGNAWNLQWGPLDNAAPASNYATLDSRNAHPCLDHDASTAESSVFGGTLPFDYAGGGLTVYLDWAATSATSNSVVWQGAIERVDLSSLDIDADSFASAQSATTAAPATNGMVVRTTITFTSGAQMDSLAAGEMFRLKITRDATNGSDTMTGDAELLRVMMVET